MHGCGRSAISTSRRRGSTAAGTSTTGCRRTSRPTGWRPGCPGWRRLGSPARRGRPARRGAPARVRGAAAGDVRRPRAAPEQPDLPPRRARPGLLRQGLRARGGAATPPAPRTWPPGPAVIDAAVASLDAIPAPIADSLLGAVRGLAAGIPADADPGGAGGGAGRARPAGRPRAAGGRVGLGRRRARVGRRWPRCCPRPRRSTSTWPRSPPGPTPSGTG